MRRKDSWAKDNLAVTELNDIQPNPSFQINLPDTFYSKISLGIKHQSNGNPDLSHAMPDRPMLNFILAHLGMVRILADICQRSDPDFTHMHIGFEITFFPHSYDLTNPMLDNICNSWWSKNVVYGNFSR